MNDGYYLVVDNAGYVYRTKQTSSFGGGGGGEIDDLRKQVTELSNQVKQLQQALVNSVPVSVGNNKLEIIPTPFSDHAKAVYSISEFRGNAVLQVSNSNGVILKTYTISRASGEIEIGNLNINDTVLIFSIVSNGKIIVSTRSVKM